MDKYRSFDGSNNNAERQSQGATGGQLLRLVPAAYADGVGAPGGADRPSPRIISNVLCRASNESRSSRYGSANMLWAWGQFLDHELDFTPTGREAFDISIPYNDADPAIYRALQSAQSARIPFHRSAAASGTGASTQAPRQQINEASSYIDASNVYGSTLYRARALRTFTGGKLRSSLGPGGSELLPPNTDLLDNDHERIPIGRRRQAFVAGDVRANEHAVLTAMHTLFLREHNRLCDEFAPEGLADEEVYQKVRRIVGGFMQRITFNEFLPILVGASRIPQYRGYRAGVDATISNVFATACYRLGHSMLPETIPIVNQAGAVEHIALRQLFFNPDLFRTAFPHRPLFGDSAGVLRVDDIIRGLVQSQMRRVDIEVTESLRSFLFQDDARRLGRDVRMLDLPALNIQRGRDHGLGSYNDCREAFDLQRVRSVTQITNDPMVQQKLGALYDTTDDIDVWVGALCEDPLSGAEVGPLISTVLIDQFVRLRDGDRFWYQTDPGLTSADIARIESTTLADIIKRNTNIARAPGRVMTAHIGIPERGPGFNRAIELYEYQNRLRFSSYDDPGRVDSNQPALTERLFVSVASDRSKITVSDGSSVIHGLFSLTLDERLVLFHCQKELLDAEPQDQNLFAAEGTVVLVPADQDSPGRLYASGRDDEGSRPRGWIFNAADGDAPADDRNHDADLVGPGPFQVLNRLRFSDFDRPGFPTTEPRTETLRCQKLDDRHLTIDNASGALRIVGLFTMRLLDRYEVYTLVDKRPPGVGLEEGQQLFASHGTAVLFLEGGRRRLLVVGHDRDFTGQGWIFDATEEPSS